MSSCAGGYADELMCGSLYVCTVRAHKGFIKCASEFVPVRSSRVEPVRLSILCETRT